MAEAIGALRVDLAMNVAQLKSDMGKVKQVVTDGAGSFRKSMNDMTAASNRTANSLGTLRAGVVLGVATGLARMVAAAIAAAAETDTLAKHLGMTAESLQKLRYASSLAGVSNEELAGGLSAVSKKITELNAGTTEGAQRLALLGVRVDDLSNKRPDEAFAILADRINAIKDPAYKSAAAIELFGSNADSMMKLVAKGSTGLRDMGDEAQRLGLVLEQSTLDKATLAHQELKKLGVAAELTGQKLSAELAPGIKATADILTSPAFQSAISGAAFVLNEIAKGIASVLNYSKDAGAVRILQDQISGLSAEIELLDKNIANFDNLLKGMADGGSASRMTQVTSDLLSAVEERARILDKLQSLRQRQTALQEGRGHEFPLGLENMRGTRHFANATGANADGAGPSAPVDVGKLLAYSKALEDLRFKTRDAEGAFKNLAPGTADAAKGLDIFNESARKTYEATGQLSPKVVELNNAQLKLAGALLTVDMLSPMEKYARDLEKVKLLLDSGAISQETYQRKLYELKEAFISAGGAAVSFRDIGHGVADAFSRNFEEMIFAGKSWRDAMVAFAQDVAKELVKASITKPLANSISTALGGPGGFLSTLFSAKGNAFNAGRVMPFADGGVLGGPVSFPMRGGIGVAGEAGPEAILPLERGADGRLGVSNNGGAGGATYNIDARGSDAGVADRIMHKLAVLEKGRPNPVAQLQAYRKRFPTR